MPSEAELLAAVYADPEADAPRAVYADFLNEKGHPLGELISLQLARAAGRRGNKKREQALLDQHGHALWPGHPGVLGGTVPPLHTLDRGFPGRAFNIWYSDMSEAVKTFIGAPGWATVKTFLASHDWPTGLARRVLLGAPMPMLAAIEGLPPAALATISDDQWARFPRLETIQLAGRWDDINAAVASLSPGLKARVRELPRPTVGQLGSVTLRLRKLEVPKKITPKAAPRMAPSKSAPGKTTPPGAFWEEFLSSARDSDAHRHLSLTADKTLDRLLPELPEPLVERIYARYVAERGWVLWRGLARIRDVHLPALLRALTKARDLPFEGVLVVAAHASGRAEGVRAAGAFFSFADKSTNLPALYKRLPKFTAADALVDGIEAALAGFKTKDSMRVPMLPFYAAAHLLARERPGSKIWPSLERKCRAWGAAEVLARARAEAK